MTILKATELCTLEMVNSILRELRLSSHKHATMTPAACVGPPVTTGQRVTVTAGKRPGQGRGPGTCGRTGVWIHLRLSTPSERLDSLSPFLDCAHGDPLGESPHLQALSLHPALRPPPRRTRLRKHIPRRIPSTLKLPSWVPSAPLTVHALLLPAATASYL